MLEFLSNTHKALDSPVPHELGVVTCSVILTLGKWRQEDQDFKAV